MKYILFQSRQSSQISRFENLLGTEMINAIYERMIENKLTFYVSYLTVHVSSFNVCWFLFQFQESHFYLPSRHFSLADVRLWISFLFHLIAPTCVWWGDKRALFWWTGPMQNRAVCSRSRSRSKSRITSRSRSKSRSQIQDQRHLQIQVRVWVRPLWTTLISTRKEPSLRCSI